MKKVGLLGLGKMGRNHLRILNLLGDVEIAFIYDIDTANAKKVSEDYNLNYLQELDFNIISEVDAVIVATPTSTHFDYLSKLIGKVKNIFIEKPITSSFAEALSLKEILMTQKSTYIQVGFIERYNPSVKVVKDIVKNSEVFGMDFSRTNKLSSRITDVDVISDLMIHDIDLAIYLNGSVKDISAKGFVNNNLIDYAVVTLEHSSGVISRLEASRITERKKRSIQVTAKDLYIDCDLLQKEVVLNRQTVTYQYDDQPYKIISTQENIEVLPGESLLAELQDFVSNISSPNDKRDISPTFTDGFESTRICDLIREKIYKDSGVTR